MRRRRHAMITPQAATTSDALLEALLDARRVELALLDDLTDAQMLGTRAHFVEPAQQPVLLEPADVAQDRKSTRLNSSHSQISYAVFCLKKKKDGTGHDGECCTKR